MSEIVDVEVAGTWDPTLVEIHWAYETQIVWTGRLRPECSQGFYGGANRRRPRGKGPCLCAECVAGRVAERGSGTSRDV